MWTRVELLPTFIFTGKTVKNSKFTDNYQEIGKNKKKQKALLTDCISGPNQ